MPHPRLLPIAGSFGSWTVKEYVNSQKVLCVCACGREQYVKKEHLCHGHSKSCNRCARARTSLAAAARLVDCICIKCGKWHKKRPDIAARNKPQFCSMQCAARNRSGLPGVRTKRRGEYVTRNCKTCEKQFDIRKSAIVNSNASGNFCCRPCYNEWLKTLKGPKNKSYTSVIKTCEWCGKAHLRIPARIARATHCFCSRRCKGRWHSANYCGENNPTWRGGNRQHRGPDWLTIRQKAIRRQSRCAICNSDKRRNVHHIIPYRISQANFPENLVTLCATHHMLVERITNTVLRNEPAICVAAVMIQRVNEVLRERGIEQIKLSTCQLVLA